MISRTNDLSLRVRYADSNYHLLVNNFNIMPDEKEGIRRTAYKGVIFLRYHGVRMLFYEESTLKELGHNLQNYLI